MKTVDRDILRLAVPALGALIAEPLFLLADSAMIGHLGVTPLAGLGIASAVLQTIIGLMVFLAYATTPAVARHLGAGNTPRAVSVGVDGLWLALALGVVIAVAGSLLTPTLVGLFQPTDAVATQASTYLSISMWGVPAMLVVFAATGLLRGLQNTRTPLWVAGVGFGANIVLNFLLIYGLGLGIAGSAVGTVIAQWLMVAVYIAVIVRLARRHGAAIRPQRAGIRGSALSGGWLFVRTASLRAAMLLATFVATGLGATALGGFQVVITLFATLAFALDAVAIAAQALIGKGLGASDTLGVRAVLRRCLLWGVGSGVVLGAVIALLSPVLGVLFTGDPDLAAIVMPSLLVLAVGAPLSGLVFVLDGVLIGAGDVKYLALTGLLNLACFVPLALAVAAFWAPDAGAGGAPDAASAAARTTAGLAWLTAAFALGYIAARALTLGLRARTSAWMRTGA